jgi:DNA-binding NtrC family response regulator
MSRILIVEDEKNLRLLYATELAAEGYEIVTASTAEEGIGILNSDPPDCVVMDIRMPGMDGLEALGRILERHPNLPVILNSAYSSYRENFLSWTADAYIVKSSDLGPLKDAVRRAVHGGSRRTAHPAAP